LQIPIGLLSCFKVQRRRNALPISFVVLLTVCVINNSIKRAPIHFATFGKISLSLLTSRQVVAGAPTVPFIHLFMNVASGIVVETCTAQCASYQQDSIHYMSTILRQEKKTNT